MNERLKELARQAKPSPNLIWEDAELERFAELVRQDYLRELKALKPVAYWNNAGYEYGASDEDFIYPELRQHHIQAGSHADYWNIPLYALDEVNHD